MFFSLPVGITAVKPNEQLTDYNNYSPTGRVEGLEDSLGRLVSFLGFLAILLLRCSPLGMAFS